MKKLFLIALTGILVACNTHNKYSKGVVIEKKVVEAHTDTIFDPVIQTYVLYDYPTQYLLTIGIDKDTRVVYSVHSNEYVIYDIGDKYATGCR